MKVGHLNVTRPMWWDRTPLVVGQTGVAGGPVLPFTSWTYTVPSNRRAYCDSALVDVFRTTVATTTAACIAFVRLEDASFTDLGRVVDLTMTANVPGSFDRAVVGAYGILTAGMRLVGVLGDSSTGGVTSLRVDAKLTEYDV